MESPVKTKTFHSKRKAENGKSTNRQQNKQKKKRRATNDCDGQMSEVCMSEFDEVERLCLPKYKFKPKTPNEPNYPKCYNVQEYQKLNTAAERRKYRDSKDLRKTASNNDNQPSQLESLSLDLPCFKQLRGHKCENPVCSYKHEFRVPKRLRLCKDWKKGSCPAGQFCSYLHSEFPCRFHYLGMKNSRHDPKTCRFYHGGPLPKEYEEMFLDSIDPNKCPSFQEMYEKQSIQLAVIGLTTNVKSCHGMIKKEETESVSENGTDNALETKARRNGEFHFRSFQTDDEGIDEFFCNFR